MTRWTDYIDWYFQPMEEKPETAEKMLEDGINDGTYARILDAINVNMGTPFLNAVIQFAEDYAAQSTNVVKEITDEEIFKEADNYAELARTFEDHGLEENISMDFARGATWMRDKLTLK